MSSNGAEPIRRSFPPRLPRLGPRARPILWTLCAAVAGAGCGGERTSEPIAPAHRLVDTVSTGVANQAVTAPPTCLTLQRGASPVADTQIANKAPPSNYGGAQVMNAGTVAGTDRQTLIRFDLSDIPPGAVVQSARLTLNYVATGPGTVRIHRITAPWLEGQVTWQSFGAAFAPAIDATFDTHATATTAIVDLAALFQAFVDGAPNHGILLEQPGPSDTRFASSEWAAPAERPRLDICYSPGCAGAPLGSCNAREGAAALSGGTTIWSAKHSGVISLSQSPGGNHTASSPTHRLRGGVVGATQDK